MNCAMIRNGIVIDVADLTQSQIEAAFILYDQVINVTNEVITPSHGWTHDGANFSPSGWKITKLSMQQRFTLQEQLELQTALNANVALLQVLNRQMALATFVDLKRTDTQQGVYALAQSGVITMQRATTILTTPPTEREIYREAT